MIGPKTAISAFVFDTHTQSSLDVRFVRFLAGIYESFFILDSRRNWSVPLA